MRPELSDDDIAGGDMLMMLLSTWVGRLTVHIASQSLTDALLTYR